MYSKAAEAASESFNKVKTWINLLPGPSQRPKKDRVTRSLSSACVNAIHRDGRYSRGNGENRPSSAPDEKLSDTGKTHLDNLMKYCRRAFGELEYTTPEQERKCSGTNVVIQTSQYEAPEDHVWKHVGSLTDSGFDHNSVLEEPTYRNRFDSYNSAIFSPRVTNGNSRGTRPTPFSLSSAEERSTNGVKDERDIRSSVRMNGPLGDAIPRPVQGDIQSDTYSYSRRVSVIRQSITSTDDTIDAYSKNYSLFVEHVVVKSNKDNSPAKSDKEASRKESRSNSTDIKEDISTYRPIPKGAYAGRMKLCLQYFGSSRILRVIVLRAYDLNARKGNIHAKLSVQCLHSKRKYRKLKLRKVKANESVAFNEEVFFENITESDIDDLTLTVRLYNKEGLFKSTKRLGEMVIPVFKYDLSMDTNVWGNLRQWRANQQIQVFCDDDDIEVISDDRSIHASVTASVKPGSRFPSPVCRRVNSLPPNLVFGVDIMKKSYTGELKVPTNVQRTISNPGYSKTSSWMS